MCVAADPVHDAAVFHQLSRPVECRLRGPDHEPGPRLFPFGLGICRRHLFRQLRDVPDSRQCAARADRCPAHALHHHGGVAETGFFPGMILYLTFWFPSEYRGRFTAIFMLAIPLSAILGGPMSGFILGMDGVAGFRGWQWLFLIEGSPACLLAFAVLKFLPDRPRAAGFLSGTEKQTIAARLAAE